MISTAIEQSYNWVETFTGRRFDLSNPDFTLVAPEDIAHSLSLQCRFNGHCHEFYSVAEHCIRVHDLLSSNGYEEEYRVAGLLHDASEAYLCDLPGPVKRLLPDYEAIEALVQQVIWDRFNVVPSLELHRVVKKFDTWMLCIEAKALMPSGGDNWGYGMDVPNDYSITSMTSKVAKREFLHRLALHGLETDTLHSERSGNT